MAVPETDARTAWQTQLPRGFVPAASKIPAAAEAAYVRVARNTWDRRCYSPSTLPFPSAPAKGSACRWKPRTRPTAGPHTYQWDRNDRWALSRLASAQDFDLPAR